MFMFISLSFRTERDLSDSQNVFNRINLKNIATIQLDIFTYIFYLTYIFLVIYKTLKINILYNNVNNDPCRSVHS